MTLLSFVSDYLIIDYNMGERRRRRRGKKDQKKEASDSQRERERHARKLTQLEETKKQTKKGGGGKTNLNGARKRKASRGREGTTKNGCLYIIDC